MLRQATHLYWVFSIAWPALIIFTGCSPQISHPTEYQPHSSSGLHPPFSAAWKAGRERDREGGNPRNKQNTTSHCCSKKQQVSRGERKRVQVVIRDRAFESLERVAAFEKRTPCSPLTRHRHQLALSSMLQDQLNNKNMSASFQSVLQPFLKLFPSWQQPRLWNDNFEHSFFPLVK